MADVTVLVPGGGAVRYPDAFMRRSTQDDWMIVAEGTPKQPGAILAYVSAYGVIISCELTPAESPSTKP